MHFLYIIFQFKIVRKTELISLPVYVTSKLDAWDFLHRPVPLHLAEYPMGTESYLFLHGPSLEETGKLHHQGFQHETV